ncbi:hypothetical protein EAE91_10965 [Photorhabdus noenieputensis]|nr:hypothetical protein [Photorhabdus noenieputensis]
MIMFMEIKVDGSSSTESHFFISNTFSTDRVKCSGNFSACSNKKDLWSIIPTGHIDIKDLNKLAV